MAQAAALDDRRWDGRAGWVARVKAATTATELRALLKCDTLAHPPAQSSSVTLRWSLGDANISCWETFALGPTGSVCCIGLLGLSA
jgi:hypothetical protein